LEDKGFHVGALLNPRTFPLFNVVHGQQHRESKSLFELGRRVARRGQSMPLSRGVCRFFVSPVPSASR